MTIIGNGWKWRFACLVMSQLYVYLMRSYYQIQCPSAPSWILQGHTRGVSCIHPVSYYTIMYNILSIYTELINTWDLPGHGHHVTSQFSNKLSLLWTVASWGSYRGEWLISLYTNVCFGLNNSCELHGLSKET